MPNETPSPAPAAPAPAPAKKSNTLVIVLCVVLGLILLLLGSCVATCLYLGKKANTFVAESEKNPEITALSIAAALKPGVEVVSKDLEAGTIVLRNKKTGETVKLDARDINLDHLESLLERIAQGKGVPVKAGSASTSASASASASGSASGGPAAAGAGLKNFPADFPVYTGGGARTLESSQQTLGALSTAQQIFETSDSPEAVAAFFAARLAASGYRQTAAEDGAEGIHRVFQQEGMSATVTLSARVENGRTRVEASQVRLKP
ncbi:MAG: hypothetical protein JNG83_02150 [Opitutaceae bacterium]|nr:hypothetical protein [Opitutaceae bacterium]